MATISGFDGFPAEALTFLEDLKKNNNKAWFDANRQVYDEAVLEPSRAFVVAMGTRLREIVPAIRFEPRVNGSLFRLNRDTRFSKDKTPYKTAIGIVFWEGAGKRMDCPGFYFHFQPGVLLLASGMHVFPRELLGRYRDAAVDPHLGPELRRAADAVETFTGKDAFAPIGCGYVTDHYKRVPRGYDAEHPNADLLRLKGLGGSMELALPREFGSPDLIDYCLERYRGMLPLHHWLMRMLGDDWGS